MTTFRQGRGVMLRLRFKPRAILHVFQLITYCFGVVYSQSGSKEQGGPFSFRTSKVFEQWWRERCVFQTHWLICERCWLLFCYALAGKLANHKGIFEPRHFRWYSRDCCFRDAAQARLDLCICAGNALSQRNSQARNAAYWGHFMERRKRQNSGAV